TKTRLGVASDFAMVALPNLERGEPRGGMGVNARVLLGGREDGLIGPLAEGLDRMGWRTVTARGPYAATTALADLQVEAAIIDLTQAEDPAGLARRLRTAVHPRRLPVVAIGD